ITKASPPIGGWAKRLCIGVRRRGGQAELGRIAQLRGGTDVFHVGAASKQNCGHGQCSQCCFHSALSLAAFPLNRSALPIKRLSKCRNCSHSLSLNPSSVSL